MNAIVCQAVARIFFLVVVDVFIFTKSMRKYVCKGPQSSRSSWFQAP